MTHRKVSRFALALALALAMLTACGPTLGRGVCRHDAMYAATVARDAGYSVQLQYGYGSSTATRHIQAQALVNGAWQYLCIDYPRVYVCERDANLHPIQTVGVREAFEGIIETGGRFKGRGASISRN